MEIETSIVALVLAGVGSFEYIVDLDVLTFSALESAVTRVRYRHKTEDANASAIILGLLNGKDGQKNYDAMIDTWGKLTGEQPQDATAARAAKGVASMMRDFAGGGL